MRISAAAGHLAPDPLSRRSAARTPAGDPQFDTAALRCGSGLLNRTPMLLPTMHNVRALSALLGENLEAAGIRGEPPLEIRVDHATGRIRVSGNRPDAAEIEERLNRGDALGRQVRDTLAISSHALAIEQIASGQGTEPRGVFLRLDAKGATVLPR